MNYRESNKGLSPILAEFVLKLRNSVSQPDSFNLVIDQVPYRYRWFASKTYFFLFFSWLCSALE